ncbi:MAG: hypothetical protein M1834_001453 [Cirrosporium novae-zelandiae]|nr:MAG: hypothetical protein M1834_001453 [Cirrosporium novae-zelandiae]
MATPNPPSHPSSTPKNPAMTPSAQIGISSPYPNAPTSISRTHPSPALHSKAAHNKSPSKTPASHGISTPNAAAIASSHYDSPSAVALHFSNAGTPLPHFNGISTPMQLGSTPNPQDNEDERSRRLNMILQIIGTKTGYVSSDGLERVAKRCGLDCLWDENPLRGESTFMIAGSHFIIEVAFSPGEDKRAIRKLTLTFPTTQGSELHEGGARGAEVLKHHLSPSEDDEGHGGYVDLRRFKQDLETLAGLDKLSAEINCFEALEGLYNSLRKIWVFELKKMDCNRPDDRSATNEPKRRRVLCTKSGRPDMHSRNQVGLSTAYWIERHLVLHRIAKPKTFPRNEQDESDEMLEPKIWAVVLECEAYPADAYPPMRVANQWVSDEVEKPMEARDDIFDLDLPSIPQIDWIDPVPTTTKAGLLPDIRFVAHLEPPVTLPCSVVSIIYQNMGHVVTPQQLTTFGQFVTFESLLFPHMVQIPVFGQMGQQQINLSRTVSSQTKDRILIERQHLNSLFLQKQDYGKTISEIPFSHPRQLIEIFPILRQWVLVSSILTNSFSAPNPPPAPKSPPNPKSPTSLSASLSKVLLIPPSEDLGEPKPPLVNMTVVFNTRPTPRFMVSFNTGSNHPPIQFAIQILPNGEVQASDLVTPRQEPLDEERRRKLEDKIAGAVKISEDLGMVIELLLRELGDV